jgi:hypothetical protein
MIYHLGFTGSRDGMTSDQMRGVNNHLLHLFLVNDWAEGGFQVTVHHGDCIGADAEFHVIAAVTGCRTVAHPPSDDSRRAFCKADEIRVPKAYLDRDRDITAASASLLAAPKTDYPLRRSGTWTTIGYALQAGLPVSVILPDGHLAAGTDFSLWYAGAQS